VRVASPPRSAPFESVEVEADDLGHLPPGGDGLLLLGAHLPLDLDGPLGRLAPSSAPGRAAVAGAGLEAGQLVVAPAQVADVEVLPFRRCEIQAERLAGLIPVDSGETTRPALTWPLTTSIWLGPSVRLGMLFSPLFELTLKTPDKAVQFPVVGGGLFEHPTEGQALLGENEAEPLLSENHLGQEQLVRPDGAELLPDVP
jgi:hypothetical protein